MPDAILEFSEMLEATTKWWWFAHEKDFFSPLLFYISILEELIYTQEFKFQKAWGLVITVSSTLHSAWRTLFGLDKYLENKC